MGKDAPVPCSWKKGTLPAQESHSIQTIAGNQMFMISLILDFKVGEFKGYGIKCEEMKELLAKTM